MKAKYNLVAVTLMILGLSIFATPTMTTRAQIGGPNDIKKKVSDAKPEATTKAPSSVSQWFEFQGIVVNFSLNSLPPEGEKDRGLVAGTDALARFSLTDASTGQPIVGLRPQAWIDERRGVLTTTPTECKDKIRTFMGGLLSARADIDLNSYLMLTLNHDNTVTFINPQVSFSVTKLENLIMLPGAGADWVLSKNKEFLYITIPQQSMVAVVNMISQKLVGTIPTGLSTKPVRIALQPDGERIWVGLDGSPLIAVLDPATNKIAGTVAAGEGLHTFTFASDARFALVTNTISNTLSIIDAKTLTKVADVEVGKTPVSAAYSEASRLVYVASINDEHISVVDPAKQRLITRIPAKRGMVSIRFAPDSRFALALNQIESTANVLDAATNTLTASTSVVKSPDQVTFSRGYAYIRGIESERFSLVELGGMAKGKLAPVEIQAGQRAANTLPDEIGVADMIAPTPDGNSALIANTPDMMIYYYVEGMMAPMGTFTNYKRRPRALMLLDRSLSELSPGVYASTVRLKKGGRFDVPVMINQPRITHCFDLQIAHAPEGESAPVGRKLDVRALFADQKLKVGAQVSLRFKISDPSTKQPIRELKDVQVLVFEPPGIWQQRQWATEVLPGEYEVTQVFPREGFFKVMIRVPSRGVTYADLPYTDIAVTAKAEEATTKEKNQ